MTPTPTPGPITLPGFPDENGDGCPDGFTPNPDFVKPGQGKPCIAVPTSSSPLPDELAHTGPLDLTTLGVGALLLAAVGIAIMKGRHA